MEVSAEQSGELISESPQIPAELAHVDSSPEDRKRLAGIGKSRVAVGSKGSPASASVRKQGSRSVSGSTLGAKKSGLTSSSSGSTTSASVARGNSSGGLLEKPLMSDGKTKNCNNSTVRKKGNLSSVAESSRRSLPELRRGSLSSSPTKPSARASISGTRKSVPASLMGQTLRKSVASDVSGPEVSIKSSVKTASPVPSSSRKVASSSLDSSCSSSTKRTISKISSSSARSPSISSTLRAGSLSSSKDKISTLSGRRKGPTPETRDPHSIVLPQVEIKASDDVRLDLRGHRVRNLNASGLKLSSNLEFVYLRDNLLSTLEGAEILTRVKVLDLSFNEFKGPGFEPLENCKVLQQLYLAGNQITSMASLPQLPNLEFLSVAQNKLKSLAMASQPRLQVLAASKNRISTLKGFPYLPVLEHLRLEENPILKMPHLEAASILLVGSTLKKFNDRDLSREELAIAKRYPAHTALCIRDGWQFSRPENAAESTFCFLVEQWKDHLPPNFLLKEASVDQPLEEDSCCCHFTFVQDNVVSIDQPLTLKYQWFLGEGALSNFVPIPDATNKIYWPKHEDIKKFLKVECTPVLGEIEYPPIYAISSPVLPGSGIPKVVGLEVQGELVEGSTIRGCAEVAWCGGTPGKGVASWLRRKWNNSPVVIAGAEGEEYLPTIDDVGSSLVFMYMPVTEEGVKGDPHYKYTDFVKAAPPSVSDVQIIGDVIEGSTIKGVGHYFGGREGPSRFEWLRENKDAGDILKDFLSATCKRIDQLCFTFSLFGSRRNIGSKLAIPFCMKGNPVGCICPGRRDFLLVSAGTSEFTLTKEDVGQRLAFVYIPINFEGKEGKSSSVMSAVVKRASPKVTNVKIIGDLRENSKVTVTGIVTGGNEASSRVQWFKSCSSTFDGESSLEALSTSKIAKAFRIPLGAVGCYIVAKFTPMTPDGVFGEPAYVISDTAVETLPPSLNFLSITGDYIEGGMLTASYGYVGGHEGKSIYNWYLHEVETDFGSLIPEVSGLLHYRISKGAIGKFISFQCTPVRDDGTVGAPRTCTGKEHVRPGSPRLLSLQIVGDAVEGTSLSVEKNYWGGEEGDSVYRWFRTSSDCSQSEIRDATTASYMLSFDDIGFFISVSCEPIRSDWARGPIVLSEQVGPILPGPPMCRSLEFLGLMIEGQRLSFNAVYMGGEQGDCMYEWFRVTNCAVREKISNLEFMDLTLVDVGSCIELVYTPVRKDGIKGSIKSIVSEVISPADPKGMDLSIPDCCEDKEVAPQKTYFGGQEGIGEYIWCRTKNKLEGSVLLNISNSCEDGVICGTEPTYEPSLEDIGAYLALCWVPVRADGKRGKPLTTISSSPVSPAPPIVLNVHVEKLSTGTYSGEGEYFGGHEGESLFSWYRENREGAIELIDAADSKTYRVSDSDYNCRLLFGYMPIRSDSVVGELTLSDPTDIILPELPTVEVLALTGKAVEGDILTAVEVIPKSETQQQVWSKYIKDIKYQWFRSSEMGDKLSYDPLPAQCSCSYKVRLEDIGYQLKCECIVTDVFERSTEAVFVETPPVLPGFPRIDKLEIEGRGFHTNLYAVRGIYSGGKEGKSRIQWLRSMVGSPDLISIPGETGRTYEANVDDVGYRLVAIYTPVREDGVEGQPISASTESITVEPDILREVKQKLDLGSVKFEVLCDKDRTPKKIPTVGSLERRILEINRKRVKVVKPASKTSFPTTEIRGSYAPPFHVELFRNDQHRLRIVVDGENEADLMMHSRHLRDVVVLVIRGFAQRFNSTSLNSLLKIET